MPNIRILVVEDNPSHALSVEILIHELGYELVSIIDNVDSAVKFIEENAPPDITLVDINLQGNRDGIQLAKIIQHKTSVIFITSLNDKDVYHKTKAIRNFGYIVKPFNELSLQSILENTLAVKSQKNAKDDSSQFVKNFIFIKRRNRLEKVLFDEILYLQSDGNYCMIFTEDKKFVLKMSLVKVCNVLDMKRFVRIGKSNIININKIEMVDTTANLVMINNLKLPIGRSFKKEVLEKINILS